MCANSTTAKNVIKKDGNHPHISFDHIHICTYNDYIVRKIFFPHIYFEHIMQSQDGTKLNSISKYVLCILSMSF